MSLLLSLEPQYGPHRRIALGGAVVVILTAPLLVAGPAMARDPARGDFLEYDFHRHLGNGGGEYEGYHDDTNSHARLDILSNNGTNVQLHSAYHWTYADNEGKRQAGDVDRIVEFGLLTRQWTSALTDDDDHDSQNAQLLYEWFWLPAGIQLGDRFGLVDDEFTVTSISTTIWSNGMPKFAIELSASGTFLRNDEYGAYSVTYQDAYYFDRSTGFVIAERYSEKDVGIYGGLSASFTWTETVDVTRSSYPITIDWGAYYVFLGEIGATFLLLGTGAYAYRWRSRSAPLGTGIRFRVKRVRRLSAIPPLARPDGTGFGNNARPDFGEWRREHQPRVTEAFGAFLLDFARKGFASGDTVAVATTSDGLVGLGVYSNDVKVGQIFAEDTDVAEGLRSFLHARDFFAEFKHPISKAVISASFEMGAYLSEGDAYNVLDTYQVLQMDAFPDTVYDTGLVAPMVKGDLPAVARVSRAVYQARSDRWLRAQFETGDLGFVARVEGKIVGFAFATLVNGAGRLHTATVLPEHRNRGIGRELLRARLNALKAMGATSAITEIAASNLPSLELAFSHGFKKVSEMFIETTRTKRPDVRPLRR